MKVYIAMELDYSDTCILKVCATYELADKIIEDVIKEGWNKYGRGQWDTMNEQEKTVKSNQFLRSYEDYRKQIRYDGYEIFEYEVLGMEGHSHNWCSECGANGT